MTTTTRSTTRPLTPLQQAALDAREAEQERQSLAERLRNSETNEHISAPGTDLDSAIDIIADERIRRAMDDGTFGDLSHRRGQRLDERRAVGDVMANAGVVPAWVDERRRLVEATDALRMRGSAKVSDAEVEAEVEELRAATRTFNRSCPPPFQRPLPSREDIFSGVAEAPGKR